MNEAEIEQPLRVVEWLLKMPDASRCHWSFKPSRGEAGNFVYLLAINSPVVAAPIPLPAESQSNTSDSDMAASGIDTSLVAERKSEKDRSYTPYTDHQTEIDGRAWALIDQIGQS